MSEMHTPGPWRAIKASHGPIDIFDSLNRDIVTLYGGGVPSEHKEANARLIAAAPEMLEALRLHKAWADSEHAGPDYGGQTRDTHPDGERIWGAWWNGNLSLCDRANRATEAAIAKAEGRP